MHAANIKLIIIIINIFFLVFVSFFSSLRAVKHFGSTVLCVKGYIRAIRSQIQLGQILKPGNLAGPGIFISWHAAGNKKFQNTQINEKKLSVLVSLLNTANQTHWFGIWVWL